MAEGGLPGLAPHREDPQPQPTPQPLQLATWPTNSDAYELVSF